MLMKIWDMQSCMHCFFRVNHAWIFVLFISCGVDHACKDPCQKTPHAKLFFSLGVVTVNVAKFVTFCRLGIFFFLTGMHVRDLH